jgi:CheY-like chemotaxis protein
LENLVARRVLVVDDFDDILMLVRRVLSADGYEVDVAATLAEANAMEPCGYDAVVIDAHLGAERGTDLVEELRSEDPAMVGRCLIITGGSVEGLAPDVASLPKPFRAAELLAAVQALESSAPVVPASPPGSRADSGTLLPAAEPGTPRASDGQHLLDVVRRRRARDWQTLAHFLHDGPIQDLSAAVLQLQMLRRSAPPWVDPAAEAAQERIVEAAQSLRWMVDGPWPWYPYDIGLVKAIEDRIAWLLSTRAEVRADTTLPGLSALADELLIADIIELMLIEMAPDLAVRARVDLRIDEHLVQIDLTLAASGDDRAIGDAATAQLLLSRLADSLGISAHHEFTDRRWFASFALPR